MKKTLLGSIAIMMAAGAAAQTPRVMQITDEARLFETGGMMGLGISNSGQFLCGATNSWEGFVYDIPTDKLVVTSPAMGSVGDQTGATQFWAVDDNGFAYGWDGNGAIKVGVDGSYEVIWPVTESEFIPQAVTSDGSIVVGSHVPSGSFITNPCYYEDGKLIELKFSTTEEAGFLINKGAEAIGVSADGSIIVGFLGSRSQKNPMVYWVRQADGSYKYVPAFEGRYEDDRDENGNLKEAYTTRLPKLFTPACISANGKSIVLYIQRVIESSGTAKVGPEELAIFDVASGEYSVIPYSASNFLYSEGEAFQVTGIADDGTLVGFVGESVSSIPFIIRPDDYNNALTLTEAYPGLDLLEEYEDFIIEWESLYMVTGISADAKTVTGYIECGVRKPSDISDGIGGNLTFYVTSADYSGVEGVTVGESEAPTVYYDLQGRRVANPDRGVYIRLTGGKAEKIVF